jgi:hypothetical protein
VLHLAEVCRDVPVQLLQQGVAVTGDLVVEDVGPVAAEDSRSALGEFGQTVADDQITEFVIGVEQYREG